MEAATIAVLVITGAFLALCGWIEWHSRRRSAGTITNGSNPGSHRTRNTTGKLSPQKKIEEISQ